MPFGQLNATEILGVANLGKKDTLGFARNVLKLEGNFPVYQQHIGHVERFGPLQTAEHGCGTAEAYYGPTLRQVSPSNFHFGRLNVSATSVFVPSFSFDWFKNAYPNSIFYVCNEPEFPSVAIGGSYCGGTEFSPPDWKRDPITNGMTESFFYEDNIQGRMIRPEALADIYWQIKQMGNPSSTVLPPSAIDASFGSSYWTRFFDRLHFANGRSPRDLVAIHAHKYTEYTKSSPPNDPLLTTGATVLWIRAGIQWYRQRYYPSAQLPLDYVLSETGPDWRLGDPTYGLGDPTEVTRVWSGGQSDMMKGLSYWNSYLCYLTQHASFDPNLESGRTFYSAIHAADYHPYTTTRTSNGSRPQQYMYLYDGGLSTVRETGASVINTDLPNNDPSGNYMPSFTAFMGTYWGGTTWRMAPFGACLSVWSKLAKNRGKSLQNIGEGWVFDNGIANSRYIVNVSIPAHPSNWFTLYIPFIKHRESFQAIPSVTYSVEWMKDGVTVRHGVLDFKAFPDTQEVSNLIDPSLPPEKQRPPINGQRLSQTIWSAMLLPMMLFSYKAQTVQLTLIRNNVGGPRIFIGQPIVLPGVACTWSQNS